MKFLILIKAVGQKMALLVLVTTFSYSGYSQITPDTFRVLSTSKGVKQISYPGKLPNTDFILNSTIFVDKLTACSELSKNLKE